MKYHGICNRVFQKNTLNTIADDTNSAGDKIHPIIYFSIFRIIASSDLTVRHKMIYMKLNIFWRFIAQNVITNILEKPNIHNTQIQSTPWICGQQGF